MEWPDAVVPFSRPRAMTPDQSRYVGEAAVLTCINPRDVASR
jgi:hypothetical protein